MTRRKRVTVRCLNPKCGREFETIPSRLRQGKGKYCSRECQFAQTPEERFWALVDKGGPVAPALGTRCWVWKGSTDQGGYGRFGVESRRLTSAHRFSWEMHNGPLPAAASRHDVCVLHGCDNPPCVRPDHLRLGTQQENMGDCVDKGRANRPKGERNPAASIDGATADEIRRLYGKRGKGGLSMPALAERFNLSTSQVFRIVNHQSWKEEK